MISQAKGETLSSFVWRLVGAFLLSIGLASVTFAQQEDKLKNDPTYSIRNYKHPNKATAARGWESEVTLGRRERRQVHMGDYKRTANAEPGGSRLVFTPRRDRTANPEVLSGYNYKTPRPSVGAASAGSVAKKEARKPAKPIVPAEEVPTGNE